MINKEQLKLASESLKSITHPLRMQLLDYISINEPVNVSIIYKKLNLEQSVTSSHLAILRKHGFLNTQREGKKIFYSVNRDKIGQVLDSIKNHFQK